MLQERTVFYTYIEIIHIKYYQGGFHLFHQEKLKQCETIFLMFHIFLTFHNNKQGCKYLENEIYQNLKFILNLIMLNHMHPKIIL